ncbi:unnamed protein product [Amoebophrya sp. A120]|nr:unnamed protein product [Amoebophrya sp. A120]|eukprot:GSA120T00019347001.1
MFCSSAWSSRWSPRNFAHSPCVLCVAILLWDLVCVLGMYVCVAFSVRSSAYFMRDHIKTRARSLLLAIPFDRVKPEGVKKKLSALREIVANYRKEKLELLLSTALGLLLLFAPASLRCFKVAIGKCAKARCFAAAELLDLAEVPFSFVIFDEKQGQDSRKFLRIGLIFCVFLWRYPVEAGRGRWQTPPHSSADVCRACLQLAADHSPAQARLLAPCSVMARRSAALYICMCRGRRVRCFPSRPACPGLSQPSRPAPAAIWACAQGLAHRLTRRPPRGPFGGPPRKLRR